MGDYEDSGLLRLCSGDWTIESAICAPEPYGLRIPRSHTRFSNNLEPVSVNTLNGSDIQPSIPPSGRRGGRQLVRVLRIFSSTTC